MCHINLQDPEFHNHELGRVALHLSHVCPGPCPCATKCVQVNVYGNKNAAVSHSQECKSLYEKMRALELRQCREERKRRRDEEKEDKLKENDAQRVVASRTISSLYNTLQEGSLNLYARLY